MGGAGAIDPEQVEADGNPFVDVFLNDLRGNDAGFDDALDAVLAGAEVKGFFLEHGNHGLRERGEAGIAEHGELVFAVAIDEIGVDEKVEPVVDVLIEGAEEALLIEGAALQHFLGFDAAAVPEVVHQEMAHLPAVAHFFGDDAAEGLAVVFAGRGFEEAALLLDGGEFGVALIDDEVEQGVAHALVGYADDLFPFGTALVGAKFDFIRAGGPEFGVKFVLGDFGVVHADVFLPDTEEVNPVIESGKTCCRHERSLLKNGNCAKPNKSKPKLPQVASELALIETFYVEVLRASLSDALRMTILSFPSMLRRALR